MSLRQEFVRLSEKKAVSFTELCQRYGISRKTGYKWLGRHVNKEAKVCSIIRVVPEESRAIAAGKRASFDIAA